MNLNMAADRKSESKTVSVASDGLTQWVHLARLGRGYKTSLGGFVCDWNRYQNPQTNTVTIYELCNSTLLGIQSAPPCQHPLLI